MSADSDEGRLAAAVLDEYMKAFQERNPNLRVFSAHLHMDEATPHLHIDFVPFTTGSKRGLDTRVSLKQALAAQGFKGGTRGDTEWSQWVRSEKEQLSAVMELSLIHILLDSLTAVPPAPGEDWPYFSPGLKLCLVVAGAWTENFSYTFVLTLFLLFCGVCTAVVLWQARRVLDTVLEGLPFQEKNSKSLRLAAVCSFLISAAALVRLIWGLAYYRTIEPLLSYNCLLYTSRCV